VTLFLEVRQPVREADSSPPSNTVVKQSDKFIIIADVAAVVNDDDN
jgi:hypothetical protein